ncbi:hypothetical protein FQN54_005488 [Arachnomyces sp. PD_36]|nr:hypothetical protein FQN54_005488 [Arachnomyces sp. PD_36]
MASTFKLQGLTSLDLEEGQKLEVPVEGIERGKVLLVMLDGKVNAINANCTHYGAPLKNGVLGTDGSLTCPWHGACFSVHTGDVEDAPAPNALNKFEVFEKDGGVYIKAEEEQVKSGQRLPIKSCKVTSQERVVVVGGGSGTFGAVEALREQGFSGAITIISTEPNLPLDRTKLSKALISDPSKIVLRPQEWYSSVSIDTVSDEATSVDFEKKTVETASGKSYPYTKLILATGGAPKRLPLPGFDLGDVFILRHVTDVQAILGGVGDKNKNIVVIGSSFIGMEVGNALSKENNVTIVGMEKAPLERVMGEQIGSIFRSNLEKSGVKFHMSASVDKATPSSSDSSKVGAVHLKDGTVLPADLVVLGVGVAPATQFLKENTSIKLEQDGSIKTDETFAVQGLQDVYAIGDIATYPYHGPGTSEGGSYTRIEHWNVAQNAGRSVGFVIAKSSVKPKRFIPVFWSALGAQLRYCGNTPNGWDGLVIKGDPDNAKFAAYYTLGDIVVAVATMGMDPVMAKSAYLMRKGKMPSKKELEGGVDILAVHA